MFSGLGLYPFIGSKSAFLKPYSGVEQEALYQQAMLFWNKLDSVSFLFPLILVIVGGISVWYYYVPFNNTPHRHYKPKYWWMMMAVCAIMCFLLTLGVALVCAPPKFEGTKVLEFKLALSNMLYAVIAYGFVSFIWCNFGKTNAYRYLKSKYL